MSSSIICQNFVQNAWKKELCSNCFKSKDEHRKASSGAVSATSAIAAMIKSTTTTANNLRSANGTAADVEEATDGKRAQRQQTKGIIKTKKSAHKRTVNFKVKLAQVIGYGGEDWSEEEEDVVAYEETVDSDQPTEEERELIRLTRNNTDFNQSIASKKLQLGKPLMDSEGKKKTLLVQVTPFGQEAAKETSGKQKISACNKFSKDAFKAKEDNEKFKEVTEEFNALNDVKILKKDARDESGGREKSLLDEIAETLEKSKISVNPSKKIVQKEIILKPIGADVPEPPKVTKLTRNPAIKEKKTYQSSKSLNLIIDNVSRLDTEKTPFDEKEKDRDKDSANGGSSLDDSSSHCGSEDSNDSNERGDASLANMEGIPSRELVGEPDGRAESDGTDEPIVPALPIAPPPVGGVEKPKIPMKPATIMIRKPPSALAVSQVVLSTFNSDKSKIKSPAQGLGYVSTHAPAQIQKRDSNGSDIAKKRKAPRPPQEETNSSIYMRKSTQVSNADCPVVREKEKRERASSCTPKPAVGAGPGPEPAPRRSLSLSTDSLASNGEEKKKRGKFSLKKLLRMGGSSGGGSGAAKEEEKPMPKPRLVIVHPLDMKNDEKIENEQEYVNTTFLKEQISKQRESRDGLRPPPPPRNYENYEKPEKLILPPKVVNNAPIGHSAMKKVPDSVYANIGEVRNAITPNKPQRTASMREAKDGAVQSPGRNVYEPVVAPKCTEKSEEHVYDYIGNRSSSPECDSKMAAKMAAHAPAQNGGMSRSVSMTYCGSETESEIYSPYSYYGSESEVAEDEQECCYGNGLGSTGRTHKLRSKKGRSIVHKNLEDNYGAVVVANHEALAQVLENIQQTLHVPAQLRSLKTTENLRWNDFALRPPGGAASVIIGNCAFHQATWNGQNVTLMIAVVPSSPSCSLGALILQPVTEFSDLVPAPVIAPKQSGDRDVVQATVSVLPHLQINSIANIGECLKARMAEQSEPSKSSTVLLLQLVNGLKTLQAQGVEELPLTLNSFVLAKDVERQEAHSRLYILHPNEDRQDAGMLGTLCRVVSKAMGSLPVDAVLKALIQSLLDTERAVTLSQVKSVLEFSLWGPSDVALGSTAPEREFVLQRWLDLQRATVLHGLVCAKVQLTVYEECHLLFLVRSNAKMMCDASLLLESVKNK